jgi:hypothetical protein
MNHVKPLSAVALAAGCAMFVSSALADPREGGPASCMAYEAADVSPPGSESGDFSQYGMPGILAFIDLIVSGSDFRHRGDVISAFSQVHAGSHHGCDEAVGIPPGAE